jgi:hypothetical protein
MTAFDTSLLATANEAWEKLVRELKDQKKDLLAAALAHARLLGADAGKIRIGYGPQEGLFRRQAERLRTDAEAVLTRMLGSPAALSFEEIAGAEGGTSIAQQESDRAQAREARIVHGSRASPAVLAATRILGGTVESVRVLHEEAEDEAEESITDEPGEEA